MVVITFFVDLRFVTVFSTFTQLVIRRHFRGGMALRFAARGSSPRHTKTACAEDREPAAQGEMFRASFRHYFGGHC
jgi:hypothetical protein